MHKKILVVDDEPDLLELVTFRLEKSGFRIIYASDAETALEILKTEIPDLILLDLLLPKLQGDDLCRMLKKDKKYKKIPILIFTASIVRVPSNFASMGAEDYILKPFEADVLIDKINKLTA